MLSRLKYKIQIAKDAMLSIKYKVQIAKDERGAYYNADPVSPPGCQVRFFSSV